MNESSAFESQGSVKPEYLENIEHLDIPIELVIEMQKSLFHAMVPESIQSYMTQSDGEHVGIEDELFMRWQMKYSALFREFCDSLLNPRDDGEVTLRERVMIGALRDDDYVRIQTYLEDPVHENREEGIGGAFFVNETEEQEFLWSFMH